MNMNKLMRRKTTTPTGIWPILGGAALLAVVFVIAKNFPSLRRYIKIERM